MKKIIIPLLCLLATTACSDWLNLKPSDRIVEGSGFSTIPGFRDALNGIYIELNQNALYGRSLTCEFVEILAQRYRVDDDNTNANLIAQYNYTDLPVESRISSIWATGYNLIANTNLLIKNCDKQRGTVLPEDYYHLVKGEALALRAFLHFDLFRLFGPVYKTDSTYTAIPYYTEFRFDVPESPLGYGFMEKVITDLTEAESLLAEYDPVITNGTLGDTRVAFFTDRNLRLNYYAVQALLARAYYYMGWKEQALDYALKVIEIQERWFPWVTLASLGGDYPDRMFSTEVLFALQNTGRNTLHATFFDGNILKENSLLAPQNETLLDWFLDESTDYRFHYWYGGTVELGGMIYRIFNKFEVKGTEGGLKDQLIPLIRVSEMYLIAAELAPTAAERRDYMNTLRNHRGNNNISSVSDYYIKKEWQAEFAGEGQLFFFYKRRADTYIDSRVKWDYIYDMSRKQYVLPIPQGELQD